MKKLNYFGKKFQLTSAHDGVDNCRPSLILNRGESDDEQKTPEKGHPKPPAPLGSKAVGEDPSDLQLPSRERDVVFPSLHQKRGENREGREDRDGEDGGLLPWLIKAVNLGVVPPHETIRNLFCVREKPK